MSPKNNSSFQSPNYINRISKALEFAVSEWLLMFLLFIDACFTYLIAKFASYCQIQGPCLLCSRYDHVLAKDKNVIYRDSICNRHKSEISSLVLCHVHDKLVNVHRICEKCTNSKLNDKSLRLLIGKMKSNPLIKDNNHDSSGSRICFCCNEQYLPRNYDVSESLYVNGEYDVSESLYVNGEYAKNERNIFVDESLESLKSSHIGNSNRIAPSSNLEYQKIDVNSDNESTRVLVPEVNLNSNSQFENSDFQNDLENTETCETEELRQDDANKEDMSQITEVSSSNNAETPADVSLLTTNPPKTVEQIKDPVTEIDQNGTTNSQQMSNYLDLGDAYKLAISTKGRQLSEKFLESISFKDSSTKVNEDLKAALLSHRSNDSLVSPKLSLNSDELATGMQFLQSRISLERNESNLSLDGSVVSEIDGENIIDRLKRQIEHDKKLMGVLYKELEEERNASAVATNQAMAMITRLQEEKSALYTEALQSLRMMEEQAEYDNQALQNANYVIQEKDKQIQDLEEILRKMSGDESMIDINCSYS